MKYTSAQANKELKILKEQLDILLEKKKKAATFLVALGENPENVRPAYDLVQTQEKIQEIQTRIVNIKHAINQFNVSQPVPGFLGATIDQVLVWIPHLSKEKAKLQAMVDRIPKERVSTRYNSSIVEYMYTNYDIELVEEMYKDCCDELAHAQTALDLVNSTIEFEIEI